jgi:uncharacterized protein (DUF1778 family)
MAKTAQLQIRVSPKQKAALKRLARAAGQDVSTFVLSRVLPPATERFAENLRRLGRDADARFALAALHDVLVDLAPGEFVEAVAAAPPPLPRLSPALANYVAAMVEHAAAQKGVRPPSWVADIVPLEEPFFGAPLRSLRPHLLRAASVAFKRRNIFVDAAVGDRV